MPHSQGFSNNPYPEPNQPNSSYYNLILKVDSYIVSCLCLGLPEGLFLVGEPVKILKVLLPSSILATWPAHLNLLDFIFHNTSWAVKNLSMNYNSFSVTSSLHFTTNIISLTDMAFVKKIAQKPLFSLPPISTFSAGYKYPYIEINNNNNNKKKKKNYYVSVPVILFTILLKYWKIF